MIFQEAPLSGAYIIDLDKREDTRGFFARAWCENEFKTNELATRMVQGNISYNVKKGTLRGMHYQLAPYAEAKLVRCTRGVIYDVMVDLRPSSPTYKQWMGMELSAVNRLQAYVPEHFAHGYVTLEDESEVMYLVSECYRPECERGFRYDDPAIKINWPVKIEVVSEKDATWPGLTDSSAK